MTRWDLDKTYLRTEFETLRDLVRTAMERPDEKRTHAGAGTLLREMARAGAMVHILSGSPEQMRRRLEGKLRLDGIAWDAFTLKPNLENMLRLRFRALRDQLGYKLPSLLDARVRGVPSRMNPEAHPTASSSRSAKQKAKARKSNPDLGRFADAPKSEPSLREPSSPDLSLSAPATRQRLASDPSLSSSSDASVGTGTTPAAVDSSKPGGEVIPKLGSETLFGDDAEADAFVYSLYADVISGHVPERVLMEICERGRVYADVAEAVRQNSRLVQHTEAVERILIHLEGQTPPDVFRVYGVRVVPFYNYLQAAFVVHEDGRVPAEGVLRVGLELIVQHRFDGDALARSYQDLARRGHLRGIGMDALTGAFEDLKPRGLPGMDELQKMLERLPSMAAMAKSSWVGSDQRLPDYLSLVQAHNPRHRK